MAGYTWPVISMIPSYRWMAKWILFTHFGDNIRDLFLKGSMVNLVEDASYLVIFLFFVGFPFLSMWFTGAYYCDYVDDVDIAVLDEDNSQLSRQHVGIARYILNFCYSQEVPTHL